MSNSSKPRLRVGLIWPASLSPQPITLHYIQVLNPLQPTIPAPNVVTPIPMQASQPLGENVIIAVALDTSQLYAGDPTLTDVQLRHPTGHWDTWGRSISHWHSSRSPSRGRQSHRGLSHSSHRSISSSHSPSQTAEAKEDLLTVEEEAQHHIGIRSVTLSNLPPPQQMKVNYILIEHLIATELSILYSS